MAAAAAPAPAPAAKRRHTTALFSQSEWEHAQECWSRNDYASARPHLERLAALGDPAFESQLGTISYHGLGVPLEWVKAARLYAAASERGDTIGSVWLGVCLYYGFGVAPSTKRGLRVLRDYAAALRELADGKDPEAMYLLALLHHHGLGVQKSDEKKWQLVEASSRTGFVPAKLLFLYIAQEAPPAVASLAIAFGREAVEWGAPIAKALLASCYEMGSPSLSIQKDPGSAIKLFLEAADAGYPIANVVVGLKFEAGVGVPQDINRAMLEFERSARSLWKYGREELKRQNETRARAPGAENYRQGLCLELGIGVPEDRSAAIARYQRAAAQGFRVSAIVGSYLAPLALNAALMGSRSPQSSIHRLIHHPLYERQLWRVIKHLLY